MNQRDIAVRGIFTQAVEIDDERQRSEYLAQACGADTQLRRHVEDLIQANEAAGGFLGGPGDVAEPVPPAASASTPLVLPISEKPGDRIGRYKLLQQIGEGGCGVVYMAEQEQPVRRMVALKVIKLGMDTKSVIARFEAERQALALMDHPNIARVLDAGATDTGRPYFVMELVRGLKITDHCDQNNLPTVERLNLFIQVCQAIQHAHQKGIIHRDVKPSNVLVTLHDGVPVPKVIDFGIAKATQGKLTDQTLFTAVEQFLGTPAYMSPEQAERGESDIDTRSDIYALGVLLYELLTGQTPFDTRELMAAGPDTMRRTIRDREPPLPSTCLSTMVVEELSATAQRRQTEPLKLIYLVRRDLDWIVLKCLEKDRTRRYDTAKGLANDILRHLNNEPVLARPPSAGYRFQKLLTRNKAAFGAVCAVTLALILGLVASLWLYFKERIALQNERTARGRASDESRRAEAAASEVKMTLSASDFSHAVLLAEQGNGIDALAYLTRSLTLNPTNHAASTLLGTLLIYRSWMPPRVVIRQPGFMRAAQFSPDGKCIVTASDGGVARVWDADNGQPLSQPMQHGGSVRLAQFSPNGKRVVTACVDGSARVWDALTGRPVTDWLKHTMGIVYAEFSSDGKRVVTASDDGSARVWDAESGHPLTGPLNHGYLHLIRTARFSPDGRWVVSASKDGTVRVWDAAAGRELFAPLHATSGNGALFSPDGKQVVTTGDDGAQVWDAYNGQPLTPLLEHGGAVWVAQFSPDGQLLVTGADDGTARVWNAHTGQPVTPRLRHAGPVRSVEFSADAQQVLTGSFDGTVRLWDSNSGEPLVEPLKHSGWVRSARFSPDGQRVVTASDDGTARVWGPRTGQSLSEPFTHRGAVLRAEFNREGTRVLTASVDGTARVWDTQTGKPITQPMQHSNAVLCAQFSLDGNRVVTSSSDGTARVWDAQTGRPFTEPIKHADAVLWAQFSPDASRVVTACADHSARIWDAQTGRPLTPRLQHEGSVFWAQFSPDGQRLVTTADDSTARLWDAQTGQVIAEPLKHSGWVQSAQFSPGGMRIVTASLHARVWDAQNGRPLTEPLKHAAKVWSARFSPDGTRVVTASEDGSARVWDSQTGRALTPPMRHQAPVKSAEFSPDGKRIVTASLDGSARLWDATSGLLLADPWKHAQAVRYAQFRVCGRRVVTASDDGTAAIWDISPSEAPVPHWMLLLAETLSDQMVTKEGVLDQLKVGQVGTLAPILDELNHASADDPWAELGRWFLTNPLTRTISPYSKVLVADYIEDRLKEDTLESLQLAGRAANGSVELQHRIHSARAALEQHKPLERSESQPPSGAPHL